MANFFEFDIAGIDATPNLLATMRGQVVLAVNVASRCGYTPQYAGLEQLYQDLRPEGFAIVGFPCNQFGAQEPGTEQEIKTFCSSTYQVSFALTRKIDVNGANRHPLYAWMTAPQNGFAGDIEWNFEKFLIGRDGQLLKRYPSGTKPHDSGLLQDIAAAL